MPLTTELDIVNAALRKVGARAISAISDTTAAGAIAGDVLVSERDTLLRNYTWNFAVARADLTPLASAPTFEFDVAFALPTDWLRTISVHDKSDYTAFVRYKMETVSVASVFTRCIATDASDIYIVYVRSTSGDAGVVLMASAFQECLILRLARIFASGLANSNTLFQLIDKEYQQALDRAKATDEIENYPDTLSSDFWGYSIVNAAMLQLRVRRGAAEEMQIPTGIIANLLVREVDDLLRAHPWNFATARTELARFTTAPHYEFQYAFSLPSDWLRTITISSDTSGNSHPPYKMETQWGALITSLDTASAWTLGAGWTISGGKATHAAGSSSSLSQAEAFVSGATYRIKYHISGDPAGAVTAQLTGGVTQAGTARGANGTWVDVIQAVTGNITLEFSASSTFTGSIEDISVERISGDEARRVVMSDSERLYIKYVREIRNVDDMEPTFKRVLILRMEKIFAAGLENGLNIAQLLDREIQQQTRLAKGIDGIEDFQDKRPEGSWIQARRGGWSRGNSVHGT